MSNHPTLINGYYELRKVIGRGNYGKVYRAKNLKNGQRVALKELFGWVLKSKDLWALTQLEIKVLTTVSHRNIIRLFEHFQFGGKYYISYELCRDGDLKRRIEKKGRLPEKEALQILRQMSEALIVLKQNTVIHRDIKPENIFMDGLTVKLGDFGLCEIAKSSVHDAYIGSMAFQAPETHYRREYSPTADMYSLGICFYEMLFGKIPFTARDVNDLPEKKMKLKVYDETPGKVLTARTMAVLRRMVEPHKKYRISCEELKDEIDRILQQLEGGRRSRSRSKSRRSRTSRDHSPRNISQSRRVFNNRAHIRDVSAESIINLSPTKSVQKYVYDVSYQNLEDQKSQISQMTPSLMDPNDKSVILLQEIQPSGRRAAPRKARQSLSPTPVQNSSSGFFPMKQNQKKQNYSQRSMTVTKKFDRGGSKNQSQSKFGHLFSNRNTRQNQSGVSFPARRESRNNQKITQGDVSIERSTSVSIPAVEPQPHKSPFQMTGKYSHADISIKLNKKTRGSFQAPITDRSNSPAPLQSRYSKTGFSNRNSLTNNLFKPSVAKLNGSKSQSFLYGKINKNPVQLAQQGGMVLQVPQQAPQNHQIMTTTNTPLYQPQVISQSGEIPLGQRSPSPGPRTVTVERITPNMNPLSYSQQSNPQQVLVQYPIVQQSNILDRRQTEGPQTSTPPKTTTRFIGSTSKKQSNTARLFSQVMNQNVGSKQINHTPISTFRFQDPAVSAPFPKNSNQQTFPFRKSTDSNYSQNQFQNIPNFNNRTLSHSQQFNLPIKNQSPQRGLVSNEQKRGVSSSQVQNSHSHLQQVLGPQTSTNEHITPQNLTPLRTFQPPNSGHQVQESKRVNSQVKRVYTPDISPKKKNFQIVPLITKPNTTRGLSSNVSRTNRSINGLATSHQQVLFNPLSNSIHGKTIDGRLSYAQGSLHSQTEGEKASKNNRISQKESKRNGKFQLKSKIFTNESGKLFEKRSGGSKNLTQNYIQKTNPPVMSQSLTQQPPHFGNLLLNLSKNTMQMSVKNKDSPLHFSRTQPIRSGEIDSNRGSDVRQTQPRRERGSISIQNNIQSQLSLQTPGPVQNQQIRDTQQQGKPSLMASRQNNFNTRVAKRSTRNSRASQKYDGPHFKPRDLQKNQNAPSQNHEKEQILEEFRQKRPSYNYSQEGNSSMKVSNQGRKVKSNSRFKRAFLGQYNPTRTADNTLVQSQQGPQINQNREVYQQPMQRIVKGFKNPSNSLALLQRPGDSQ